MKSSVRLCLVEREAAKNSCIKVLEKMKLKFELKDIELFNIIDLNLVNLVYRFILVISRNHPEMDYDEKYRRAHEATQEFLELLTENMDEGEKLRFRKLK